MTLICSFKLAQLTCLINVGHKPQHNLKNNFITCQLLHGELWKCWVLPVFPRTCRSVTQEFSEISSSWVWENYMVWNDCLPSGSSLYLSMLAEHTCVHFPRWWIRYSEDFTHLLTGSREDLVVFLSTPFLLILFFLATTPFPSRIAKNIRGQMVVPCSRVLAFLLTVSNCKIWSSFPQILAFSPEWLRVVKSGN